MPRVLCSPSCEAVLWYRGLGLHSEGVSAQCVSRVSRSPQKPGQVPGRVLPSVPRGQVTQMHPLACRAHIY